MRALAEAMYGPSASIMLRPLSMTTGIDVVLLPSVQVRLPPLPVRVGASLTAVTVMLAVLNPTENGVMPPAEDATTLLPCMPLVLPVWSQARKVKSAVVPLMPFGTKRTWSVERSSKALLTLTIPTLYQLLPSRLYCQVPLPAFRLVMAMPLDAPTSTSVKLVE